MKKRRIEIYKAKDGYRWRLKAANGEIIGGSESYTRKYTAKRAAMRTHPEAVVVDLTGKAKGKK